VSRLTFRAPLETPRPRSAIVLVGLASITLAVSGQLAPVALPLQVAALGYATIMRRRPLAWQLRGAWLNAGLAACAAFSIAEAARGVSATVALAQFALLASGLQLLDARPRRSEFLLVALALFQVVLASSLTDSLLFPPLLMAFLPTCVWTLLVHTLRSEALEAGDPAAAQEAITPGLLGMTLVASTLSLVVALGLFFLLPRMHEGLVRAGGNETQAAGGFSDRVDLGDLGRIRGDPTVMLRVETLRGEEPAPEEAYWRGLAFDHFDGRGWSISAPDRTPVEGDAASGLVLSLRHGSANLVQRILREPVTSGVLFGAGEPVNLQGGTGRLERDRNDGVYAPQSAHGRVRYELGVRTDVLNDRRLASDTATPPNERDGARFLALPELTPKIPALARTIVAGASTDVERARALETWLRKNGRYSDRPPPESTGDPRPPLERFLFGELRGHCEYFASAMVVLARSVDLPARLVNGFAGGRRNRVGDFVELTGSDAHAWVEIHFEEYGWVRFDPTPPDLRLAATGDLSLRERLDELRSALELLWFQRVVEFDRTRQVHAAVGAWRTLQRWLPRDGGERGAGASGDWLARLRSLPGTPFAVIVLIALVAFGVWRRLGRSPQAPELPRSYAQALRLLARRGYVRADALTPRAFARELAPHLPPRGAAALAALTEAYLEERYGGRPCAGADADLRALRDSLRG
jgi:transglutaminase-like putative cysteine protease